MATLHDDASFPTRRSSDLRRSKQPFARTMRRPSARSRAARAAASSRVMAAASRLPAEAECLPQLRARDRGGTPRSEEHTSELQSPDQLVCRLHLEKKK